MVTTIGRRGDGGSGFGEPELLAPPIFFEEEKCSGNRPAVRIGSTLPQSKMLTNKYNFRRKSSLTPLEG
jgi:hypothetical protein